MSLSLLSSNQYSGMSQGFWSLLKWIFIIGGQLWIIKPDVISDCLTSDDLLRIWAMLFPAMMTTFGIWYSETNRIRGPQVHCHVIGRWIKSTGQIRVNSLFFQEFRWWNLVKDHQICSEGNWIMLDSYVIRSSFDLFYSFAFVTWLVSFSTRSHGFGKIQCQSNESCEFRWKQRKGGPC